MNGDKMNKTFVGNLAKRTTISINKGTKQILDSFKIIDRETYDSVILRIIQNMVEDQLEINDQTRKLIHQRMENLNAGKVIGLAELLEKVKEKRGKKKRG